MASASPLREDFQTDDLDVKASELTDKLPSVAKLLKSTRLKKNEKTRDIANSLRISERYLIAIEHNDFKVLPEQVYTLGFVRAYAKYLGLASSEIIEQYKNENYPQARVPVFSFPEADITPGKPKLWLALGAGCITILVLGIWHFWSLPHNRKMEEINKDDTKLENMSLSSHNENTAEHGKLQKVEQDFKNALNEESSEGSTLKSNPPAKTPIVETSKEFQGKDVSSEKTVLPQTSQEMPLKNQAQIPPQSSTTDIEEGSLNYKDLQFVPGDKFTILATALSWIEVCNAQGSVLINRTLKPDETLVLEAQPGMKFSTGNAGGLKFIFQGYATKHLGKDGEILREQSLNFKVPE
ncbi:MAG: DUF4115 domain-containing protein [Alphaproteobacteria bacterium]|nr:DUF4115 domain-containing protein [Alphaproteobacteria bacterium]